MQGIFTWNIFLVGFLTELCLYMRIDITRYKSHLYKVWKNEKRWRLVCKNDKTKDKRPKCKICVKFVLRTFIFKRTSFRPPIGAKSGSNPPYDSRHHPGVTLDWPSMVLVSKTGQKWSQFTKNLKIKKKLFSTSFETLDGAHLRSWCSAVLC